MRLRSALITLVTVAALTTPASAIDEVSLFLRDPLALSLDAPIRVDPRELTKQVAPEEVETFGVFQGTPVTAPTKLKVGRVNAFLYVVTGQGGIEAGCGDVFATLAKTDGITRVDIATGTVRTSIRPRRETTGPLLVPIEVGGPAGLRSLAAGEWLVFEVRVGNRCGAGSRTVKVLYDGGVEHSRIVFTDNCPAVVNADQADRDDDGAGDACDVCPDVPGEPSANGCSCSDIPCDDGDLCTTDVCEVDMGCLAVPVVGSEAVACRLSTIRAALRGAAPTEAAPKVVRRKSAVVRAIRRSERATARLGLALRRGTVKQIARGVLKVQSALERLVSRLDAAHGADRLSTPLHEELLRLVGEAAEVAGTLR